MENLRICINPFVDIDYMKVYGLQPESGFCYSFCEPSHKTVNILIRKQLSGDDPNLRFIDAARMENHVKFTPEIEEIIKNSKYPINYIQV